jgi:peptide/nickel transport system substrate-binding protein
MIQSGEADLIMFPSAEDCADAASAANYKCVSGPSDTYLYGRLDHSLHADERLKDPRIREAIFLAIDTEPLVDLIGLASVPDGQLGARGVIGYNPNVKPYPYDPKRAKALLAEAKADGVDVDGLEIEIIGRNTTPRIGLILEIIGGMLSSIGMNNKVAVQDPSVFNPRVRIAAYADEPGRQLLQVHVKQNPSGDFGTVLLSNYACPDINDPTGPSRSSVYCNKEFDEQLFKALALFGEERDLALQKLVKFIHDEHLILTLALLDRGYLMNKDYDFHFSTDHRIQAVYLEPAK